MAATLAAARWLYKEASANGTFAPPDRFMASDRYLETFFKVSHTTIADYVRRSVLPAGPRGQSNELLADNILELAKDHMVTNWVVTFPTLADDESRRIEIAPDRFVTPSDRSAFKNLVNGFLEGTGDVSAPADVWADFTLREVDDAEFPAKPNWETIRAFAGKLRPESRGLLICYIVRTANGPSATWQISFPRMPREKEHKV
jgi:hypothetical protein